MAEDDWEIGLDDLTPTPEAEELEEIRMRDPEPQSVRIEHAAFVLLGILATFVVVYIGLP